MFPWNSFPFDKDMQSKISQMKPEEINQYVQDIMEKMGKMFHPAAQRYMDPKHFHFDHGEPLFPTTAKSSALQYAVFETHDFVFVRIYIEQEEWLKQLKLYHTSHLLILEHIPATGEKLSIPLPALVKRKGTTAQYKEQTLEVKIPKNIDMQFSEIDIIER
nr:Hsp20/alpha crystallin family protein [uncultured Bacillus sp.]